MGLTKQYLKYAPAGNANVITSSTCNSVFVTLEGQQGRFVAVGACEHVYIWDLRLNEKAQVLSGDKYEVKHLAASPNGRHIAVGYSDGTLKTFDLRTGENVSIFVGHRSGITCLAYDTLGHRLASGSHDTDIIVWDVIAETGICRLKGHKNIITKIAFMQESNILISSSKDTLIKFWDLDTHHNFRTIVGHRTEIWSFTLVKNDKYLITGCTGSELKVWKIYFADIDDIDISKRIDNLNIDNDDSVNDPNYPLRCEKVGSIYRTTDDKVLSIVCDPTKKIIACIGVKYTVELYHLIPDDKVTARRLKRLKKAQKNAEKDGKTCDDNDIAIVDPSIALRDEIQRMTVFKVDGHTKSIDIIMGKNNEVRFCVGLSNNCLGLYSLNIDDNQKDKQVTTMRTIMSHGHRTDVRALCFSSDNLSFASASGDSIKIWNRPSLACLRTIECGYALSATFVPGDRYLIVGMKDGLLLIVDVSSGEIIEEINAHPNTSIWSVILCANGIVSGAEDKTVKFWALELVKNSKNDNDNQVLSLLHTRTLKLDDGVVCVKISPDNRLIAVSLSNSTVSIFFLDSFKFLLSLYGHNLPVTCMDISDDSTLIATGSADRNIKIWGMSLGDCHKSIFAHDNTITGLCFVPKTHYFFSCGKDGKIKEWDADNFQKIITLDGHCGQAYACAVSPNGKYLLSCGSDKVIRIYERTDDIVVLGDEPEDEALATDETSAVPGQKTQILPSKKTVNTERAAELLLECLEETRIYNQELDNIIPPAAPPALPKIAEWGQYKSMDDYFIGTLKRVRADEMEETLYLLPYTEACELLRLLPKFLKKEYQVELLSRVALCLIQAHHGPIVANSDLYPIIEEIQSLAVKGITNLRNTIGFNLHGLAFTQRTVEETDSITLFRDATRSRKQKNQDRKKREGACKRALMTM
ncbi:hypothetical protein HCN44_002674 [Aphidius gifuensis]|uniref:Small-subunit processome Utp12 domain-containing protein n=1 Tax=Aphidius gifuensis TaxID=684658 RepID=A0A835CPB5_APHGI|nr:WD repeat-containing protein 3 [Aphidius gifuensis]KAF7991112.1 hypothetical protein HCN44_002674 [Aphidius gifuensis]